MPHLEPGPRKSQKNLDKAYAARIEYWRLTESTPSFELKHISDGLDLGWEYCQNLRKQDSAAFFVKHSIQHLENFDNPTLASKGAFCLGLIEEANGNFRNAIEHYHQAIVIKEQAELSDDLAHTYHKIGQVYRFLQLYDKSLEFHYKALDINRLHQPGFGEATSCHFIGSLFQDMEQADSALIYLSRAWQIHSQQDAIPSKAHSWQIATLTGLAEVFTITGDLDSASIYLQKALRHPGRKKKGPVFGRILLAQARLAQARNQVDRALHLARQGLQHVGESRHLKMKIEAHHLLQMYYRLKGDNDKAWEHLQSYTALSDSLKSLQVQARIVEIEHEYDQEKNRKQISELTTQKDLNEEEISEKTWWNKTMLVFIGILLVVVVVIVWVWLRLRKRHWELSLTMDDWGLMYREVQHRVKNNLQLISSMLFLQSAKLENPNDGTTRQVLEDMKNRVRSMALVHQKLALEDGHSWINSRDYIQDLVNELMASYVSREQVEEVNVDAEPLMLDLDTIVPLGLIVNELITNMLKHAFDGSTPGRIDLSFRKEGKDLLLIISDNGKGISTEKGKKESFGLGIVKALGSRLNADIQVQSEEGTTWKLIIRNYKLQD